MRYLLVLSALCLSPTAIAQRYVEVKCPPAFDASLKLDGGFSTFAPADAAPGTADIPTTPAALAGAEVYVGDPTKTPQLQEERGSGSKRIVWYLPGPKIIACRYEGTERRIYRMIYPPANECSALRNPPAGKPLIVSCRTR
ncbi:hypothetical protein GCM10025771_04770 [Niveibacterium umoris]|uniref:Uncharacterized protein n=1 Tax=Niveibacterium umoris TaxID=1193620 RepID=A0A840BUE1_9RHOO|nr:STY0301 family protein [Niveibacterium umoris]MBB4013977.1 hypothetical protein [Niveibacterium umoris]